jgi:hypothetical protein
MEHAKVKSGEYEIPLIGVPKSATEEECSVCKQFFNLKEIKLDEQCTVYCKECYDRRMARKN